MNLSADNLERFTQKPPLTTPKTESDSVKYKQKSSSNSHESDTSLVHAEGRLSSNVIFKEEPIDSDKQMVAESAHGICSSAKSEQHDEKSKPSTESDVIAGPTTVITSRVVDEDSTTTSLVTTADEVDATAMDDDDASETEQPRPLTDVVRKPSTAPQIDAEQLRSDPDFAVICSFINKFFTLMRMEPVSFCQLETMFTKLEEGRVSKELVDLHLKLLRRSIVKTVSNDSFEKCILKYLTTTGLLPSEKRQLETYGYVHMSIVSKLKILRTLCDLQLDHNVRLRESIPTALRALDMRDVVTGVDKCGLAYYCQIDCVYDLRLYTTEQDDESGYSWTLVARDLSDLENLIAKLKSEDLGYVKNPNDKREFSKAFDNDGENVANMVTKKGTYVDMFLDETAIKNMRAAMVKEKEERRNRRARLENAGEPPEETAHDEEEKPVEAEDGERRVLPRRSASQKAQTNIRKYVTPKKSQEKKLNSAEVSEPVKAEFVKRDSSTPVSDDSEGSADTSDGDGSVSSDDEFKPKTQKKSAGKRQRRRKKIIEDVEDDEDSGDEDEEDVRRRAEGDFACGSCKLSDNEDILLLCDNCDDAWHTTCLKPPLWFVPAGKWYCPKCEHGMLIECLTYVQEMLIIHQRKAAIEEKKRKAAADRFRREMEYIGVSLNNIIPTTLKQTAVNSSSSSSSDDGQRRSKKKAVKKITPNVRKVPTHVQTIAEGRSRRSVKKVDYKFSEFDSVIKEACRMNESPSPDAMKEVARPQGGAGRGKDMANIIEAQKQQEGAPRASTGVPPRRFPKHRRRLNDLNDLDETDSDSEEYKANESEEDAEEDSQSSDYVPSESEFRTRRTGGGRRKALTRTQSDEDFVVSGSDDSYTSSRRRKRNRKEKSGRRAQWHSDSESEEKFEEDDTYSDDSKGKMKVKRQRCEVSSDETNDEDEDGIDLNAVDGSADGPKTRTGRPLRKAVAKSKATLLDVSDDGVDGNEDYENGLSDPDKLAKKGRFVVDSDSDVFEPDEEMDDDDDDDEEGGASSDAAVSAAHEENNMEKNVIKSEGSGHDLDIEPKLKKPKLEEEQDSTQVPAGNVKDNGISTPQANSAPTPNIPSVASPPNVNVQDAEVKPSVSDLKPPTAQAASGFVPATDMKDKRIIVVKEDSRSNLYFAPTVTASSGAELSANTPVLIPTSVIPHGITLDTSDSSYATAERKVNVGVTPVVPNPYANPSVVPQIRSYCAGQQTALPYAVANPYVMYSPNASSFPTDPQSVGHPYIGYIPGVVPNPYGQQSSMAPTKGGDRDLRSL